MKRWLAGIATVLLIGYPLIVYFGLTRGGTRTAALGLLALSLTLTVVNICNRNRSSAWRSALVLPLCLAAFWLDDRRYVLAMPVLINSGLFSVFFSTLRPGAVPLCERFARLQVDDLTTAEVVYCRQITKLWCGFFVLNGGTALALSTLGALELWTLYTGLVSYMLVGTLAAAEYTVRKYRFGRYGDGFHDRLLRAILPTPRSTQP